MHCMHGVLFQVQLLCSLSFLLLESLKDNLVLPLFVLYVPFLSCSYIIVLTYSAVQINVVVVVGGGGGGGGGAIVVVASSDHQKA